VPGGWCLAAGVEADLDGSCGRLHAECGHGATGDGCVGGGA
jgi:hypothetical protein